MNFDLKIPTRSQSTHKHFRYISNTISILWHSYISYSNILIFEEVLIQDYNVTGISIKNFMKIHLEMAKIRYVTAYSSASRERWLKLLMISSFLYEWDPLNRSFQRSELPAPARDITIEIRPISTNANIPIPYWYYCIPGFCSSQKRENLKLAEILGRKLLDTYS